MSPLSKKTGLMQNPPQDRKTKWLSYFVWDILRWSAPRAYQHYFNACDIPVAMSNFGRDTVLEAYSVEPDRIYHGVDLTQFKPLPQEQIQQRRESYGNPDFVMGAFFRNIHRKQTALLLEAWSKVSREYPDVRLLLNMRPDDPEGYDVTHYVHHFNMLGKVDSAGKIVDSGPVIGGQQMSPVWGVPQPELNLLYQVCDAQILTTMGEGFGIPIIEGYAASGLPVIMSRNTTYDELVGDHGLPIECEGYAWTAHEGAQPFPKTESIEDQMRVMIDDVGLRKKFAERNREFVKDFDFNSKIIPEWVKLLEKNVS
jgi:glycosyltransferase involved in cell wall biosynthesis